MTDKQIRILKMMNVSRAATLQRLFDTLWNKGQTDEWPKEVMDYIMWIEHEASRTLHGLKVENS